MTNDNDKTSETPVGESSNQNPDGSAKSGNANAYNTPEWAKPLMEALVAQGLTNQELLKLLTKKTDSSDAEVTDVLGAFTKPKKMPLASDRGSQVWSGTAETLDHCITWFEATAEEKGLPKTDWKAKWFDYVDAGHVERLKAMLIEETTWTAVKARLTTLYRDRSKDVEGTLEALQKYALTYQKKPLNRIEDLTARMEAYARDALKFQANMGINDYINQYWYEGLPRAWKDRYVEEVWRKETQDKTKYPDRKKVTKWIEGILDPRDVLENERIEEMHPELRTRQELAQLAEENKTRYLSKVQKGRTEIVQLKTTIDEEEMNPTKPTVGLSAPGNPVDEVDDLIKRMSDLKIQSASAAGITARQAATYSACYARLYVLRPRHAAQMSKTLAAYTATTPAIDTLLDEAWQMKDADRGGYRENSAYKELYERIHSISAVTAEGLLEPPREGTSTYKREVPPHYPSRTSRETAEPARPTNSSYTRETFNRGPAKCHWCGSPAHRVAQCTVPEKWVPDNILAKINNLWVWKANGLPIKRHTDGTYESTVREMVEAAKERIQTAEAAAVMGYESTDFDDSMYPPGMEEAQQSAYSSFAIISLDLESQDVVDDDGEVCQDTLWGRTTALSRRPRQDANSDDEDPERWIDDSYDDYDVAALNVQGETEAVANADEPGLDSEDEAAEADAAVQVELSRDDDCRAYDRWDGRMPEARRYSGDWWLIARFLATLEWPADIEPKHQRKLARVSRDYFLRRGLLFKKPGGGHCMQARVILNKTAQMDILRALHDEGGHRGERGTYTRIRDRFYWPGMARDIEGYVQSCVPCQQRDYRFYESPKVSPEPPTIHYKWDIDCISMGKDPKDTTNRRS